MKTKLIKFIVLVCFISFICVSSVLYYEVNKFRSSIFESKAIIARAQPLIEISKGQRMIDNAIAYQVFAVSTSQVVLAFAPYVLAGLYIIYKTINKKQAIDSNVVNVVYDERIQNSQ